MKYQQHNKAFFFICTYLSAMVLFVSCDRETIINDVDYKPKIVVNSLFFNGGRMAFLVGKSSRLGDTLPDFSISGATIRLRSDNKGQSYVVTYDTRLARYIAFIPSIDEGDIYRVQIQSPGLPEVSAVAEVPLSPDNLKAELKEDVFIDSMGITYDELHIQFTDRKADRNYYEVMLFYFSTRTNEFTLFIPENSEKENPEFALTPAGTFIIDDRGREGQDIRMRFTLPFDQASGTPRYRVQLNALSRDYYEYQRTLTLLEKREGSPFSPPVVLFSNIQNGLGIFAGRSSKEVLVD